MLPTQHCSPRSTRPARRHRALRGLALLTSSLTLLPLLPASAISATSQQPTAIHLLTVNDFHGRIDNNDNGKRGLQFACTTLKALETDPTHSALIGTGDLIGGSPFVSASQQDNPTLDFLNTIGLQASSVGNHEFDRSWQDLRDRVQQRAAFPYLGANVYLAGTTQPALKEFTVLTLNGIKVGLIGAVTAATPALTGPQSTAGLIFGDPIAAVNRVADQLTDGVPDNGEADVLVAMIHEGASAGVPDGSSLDKELAAGGIFARIVQETSPKVAAITTGHSHKEYAWSQTRPGLPNRPILQSGSYGEFLGKIDLTIDPTTMAVLSATASNISVRPTDPATCAGQPTFDAAQRIVTTAVSQAAVVGSKPIGSIGQDITRAKTPAGLSSLTAESPLVNLAAQVWLEALNAPGRSGADIGVMNPGGIRADLKFSAPGKADGVVTYAEAATVNPFANTLQTRTLTGAQVKTLLEQQWQDNPQRPFLKLGLSHNLSYAYDVSRPLGQRVVALSLNGRPLDPAATVRVAGSSFLVGGGGDGFTVLRDGQQLTDSGLVDCDAFVDFLAAHPKLAPSFLRTSIAVEGLPATLAPRETFHLRTSGWTMDAPGAPAKQLLFGTFADSRQAGPPVIVDETVVTDALPARTGSATYRVKMPNQKGVHHLTIKAYPSFSALHLPLTVTGPTEAADPDDVGSARAHSPR